MQFHSTVLFVKDISASKQFYTDIMQLKIEHDFDGNIIFEGGLSIWKVGNNHTIRKQLPIEGDTTRFELYFESDSLDKTVSVLKDNNVSFFHGVHEEPWGQKTIRFFDPDNNLVEVGEPMPVFVQNMANAGKSAEAISEQSGIALEVVKNILEKTGHA